MLSALAQADGALLLWIQKTVRSAFLNPLMTGYTRLGDSGLLWIVLCGVMLCFPRTRKAGLAGAAALACSLVCTNLVLKHLVSRPRPWLLVQGLVPLVAEGDPNSFPSGHTSAAFAAALAWSGTLPNKWMGRTALVMAALMGFSRLYVGVHFPSDVLCGMLVGLFSGWVGVRLYRLWERRRKPLA